MRRLIVIASLALAAYAADSAPRFEVAAIHPSDPNSRGSAMRFLPGGAVSITGMTIRNLIWLAWQLPPERVSGGPKWLDSDLYDIQARSAAGSPFSMEAQRPRIQALLADRFLLKVHRETKSSPVYVLTIAKTGLKMQEAKGSDPAANGKGSITPWNLFVTDLSRRLGRPVIDKSGLSGAWFVNLEYSTDDGTPVGIGARIDPAQSSAGPSIFTAVQEQLGLKLDSAQAPVDTLVIDAVARPTPN